MAEEAKYKCMRCGNEYSGPYSKEPKERTCPRCKSNSVRQLKKKKGE